MARFLIKHNVKDDNINVSETTLYVKQTRWTHLAFVQFGPQFHSLVDGLGPSVGDFTHFKMAIAASRAYQLWRNVPGLFYFHGTVPTYLPVRVADTFVIGDNFITIYTILSLINN